MTSCTSLLKKTSTEPLVSSQQEGIETIAILGTNDIHGALASENEKTRDSDSTGETHPVEYQRGGVAVLASYVKTLKREFGPRLLWLDGGDEFQGSVESNMEKGKGMVRFFNLAGVNGAAIGNHEFDYGPENEIQDRLGALKARMIEAQYPYLAANIVEKATGKLAQFPNTYPSKIYSTGKVKVGVIGLSTIDTPKTTLPINVESLAFADLKEVTLRESNALRQQGADIVIVTSHVGLKCESGKMPTGLMMRHPTDPQGNCNPDDELVKLLRALPAGTVDAVVSGHSHQIVHHWVSGVPVIQGGSFGRYFNLIYLNYDIKNKKLLPEQTRIEGPIPVCPKIFTNQNDCNGDRPAPKGGRGDLVQTLFHGEEIESDPAVEALIAPLLAKAAKIKNEFVAETQSPIEHERFKESPLGDLVTDAIRETSGADVALINSGGIRAPIESGKITFGQVFRSLPFDNSITILKVNGKELRQILQIAESGSRGFCSVSGVQLKVIDPQYDAPSSDLDHNGTIDPWEINRLLDIRLTNGKTISDHETYQLATLDFLVSGGDDIGWILKKIPKNRVTFTGTLIRNATLQYMKQIAEKSDGFVQSMKKPIFDPERPRLIFEKPKSTTRKNRLRGKGRRRANL